MIRHGGEEGGGWAWRGKEVEDGRNMGRRKGSEGMGKVDKKLGEGGEGERGLGWKGYGREK